MKLPDLRRFGEGVFAPPDVLSLRWPKMPDEFFIVAYCPALWYNNDNPGDGICE
jgi:hypothetical protein